VLMLSDGRTDGQTNDRVFDPSSLRFHRKARFFFRRRRSIFLQPARSACSFVCVASTILPLLPPWLGLASCFDTACTCTSRRRQKRRRRSCAKKKEKEQRTTEGKRLATVCSIAQPASSVQVLKTEHASQATSESQRNKKKRQK